MIISFAKTVDAYLQGKKICTRRDWSERHFQTWTKAWNEGCWIHDAYDKSPRVGGRLIGKIVMTCCPYWEPLCKMPVGDLLAEGVSCKTIEEFAQGYFDGDVDKPRVVLRFIAMPRADFPKGGSRFVSMELRE